MKKGFAQKVERCQVPRLSASPEHLSATVSRSTEEVFGNYIDVYDMSQAVDDGATGPVYYGAVL